MSTFCVITTINPPTKAVKEWVKIFRDRLIVEGDVKTPKNWRSAVAHCRFFPYDNQTPPTESTLKSIALAPVNHYARKNLGYLAAMRLGASCIYDTDDDNAPTKNWHLREERCVARAIPHNGWVNMYGMLNARTDAWPRGLPLAYIYKGDYLGPTTPTEDNFPIQQGLANGDPDVDAIYRLTSKPSRRVVGTDFSENISYALGCGRAGCWSPCNSQSTWWFRDAFPLMYLPAHATFRMVDIWRSFVAQRCLWAMGKRVAFHSPAEVVQERNKHDLIKDFESEIPGYLHNEAICAMLGKLKLKRGKRHTLENLRACYAAMVEKCYLPVDELDTVDAWIADVTKIRG